MTVVSIGVDHRSAPVEVREALAFDREAARRFLVEAAAALPERMLLSTCNRTELLAVPGPGAADPAATLLELLDRARGFPAPGRDGFARIYRGEEAVRHLFRVAAGLESRVLGETQILGQVKEAGDLAEECGAAGPVLRKALETALRAGKRARAETKIGEGAVSLAGVAVELAKKVFGDLSGRPALVVGAGETGALAARRLHAAGVGPIVVANRTIAKAEALAAEIGGGAAGLSIVPDALADADVVVCCAAAGAPLVTFDHLKRAMHQRKGRLLLVVDLSVPRLVEESAASIEGVFLNDVDAVGLIVDQNLAVRARAVPKACAIVEDSVRSFLAWEREMEVTPTIKALRARFDEIRRREIEANLRRIPPEARDAAVRLTESLVNRLLHEPTRRLREASRGPDGGRDMSAALRELFGVDDAPPDPGDAAEDER